MILRRLLILTTIILYINVFGMLDTEEYLAIKNLFKSYDVLIILVVVYLIFVLMKNNNHERKVLLKSNVSKFVISFLGLVFVVLFSMPFRNVSLFEALKIARLFFPLFLYFLILYDIVKTGEKQYWSKVIIFLSIAISIVVLITSFFPYLSYNLFPANHFKWNSQGFDFARTYTTGFVFCYVALIMQVIRFGKNKKLFLLIFFFLATMFQGFRSYFILTFGISVAYILISKRTKVRYKIATLAVIAAIVFIMFPFFEEKIATAFFDLFELQGTFGGRILTDWSIRIPLFLKNQLLGIGFVSNNSNMANSFGAFQGNQGEYLYSTDSGYLNLLLMFGLVGTGLFIFFLIRILKYLITLYKQDSIRDKQWIVLSISIIIILSGTLLSHSGFTNAYGLVPLAMILAIMQGSLILNGGHKLSIGFTHRDIDHEKA